MTTTEELTFDRVDSATSAIQVAGVDVAYVEQREGNKVAIRVVVWRGLDFREIRETVIDLSDLLELDRERPGGAMAAVNRVARR